MLYGVCQPLRVPYQRTLGRGLWCRKAPLLTWWRAAQGKWGRILMRRPQRGPLGLGQPEATLKERERQVRLFVLSVQKLCFRSQSNFVVMLPLALQQWHKCFYFFLLTLATKTCRMCMVNIVNNPLQVFLHMILLKKHFYFDSIPNINLFLLK